MSKYVKWILLDQYTTGHGKMPIENIPQCLEDFKTAAIKYQTATDADHVIYAAKQFDNNGELVNMRFYKHLALDDKTFNKRIEACKNYQVYAIHKRG